MEFLVKLTPHLPDTLTEDELADLFKRERARGSGFLKEGKMRRMWRLTKALVELHGGSLDLQSEVDVGTAITVRFPAKRIVWGIVGNTVAEKTRIGVE
jgi:muconolactone delta-isomerase